MSKLKLIIELVPESSFYNNVRSNVPRPLWDKIRKQCYKDAEYKCEICGGIGARHPVECHEIWEYNEKKQVQKLTGFTALCPACHEVKHIGLAGIRGRGDIAKKHFMKINKLTEEQADVHIGEVWDAYHHRSSIKWVIDIDLLGERKDEIHPTT